jgi:hypothetical protein
MLERFSLGSCGTMTLLGASALPRGACGGVSMSTRGECASAPRNTFFNHELIEFSRIRSGFVEESACWFYSCSFGLFVIQGHAGRVGAGRGLVIDKVTKR